MSLIWVIEAKYIEDYKVKISFNDGITEIIDLHEKIMTIPALSELANIEKFKKFTLNPWTIEWENGADLAPESLYRLAKKRPTLETTNAE